MHTRPFCIVNFERLCRVFPRDPQLRIESALFEWHDARKLGRPFWSDCHPADGGGGTHARQTIRWRVLGGPCTWVARRCPPPPARRRPAARSPPAASPPSPVHHVDSCCCSRCLRAAAPCPPPCRALPRTVLTTPRPSHPQPSARNRPGERMRLFDRNTYKRPDAEVLPLITPAAARARNLVRRISHATRSGQRRPVAKRSTGRGRGRAAGGGGGAAVRLRTFAIARAPPASTLSLTSALPT
jgi:hypothetical protein